MQESLAQLPFLFTLADDMDVALKRATVASIAPGAVNVAGVFLGGWGFYHSLALNVVSMSVAMGISMYPYYKHRQTMEPLPALTPEPPAPADP